MKVLLLSDDGYLTHTQEFKQFLEEELKWDVYSVLPDDYRPGQCSITSDRLLKLEKLDCKTFLLRKGTILDCVFVTFFHLFPDTSFDIIVCGPNIGVNLGARKLYSGTVKSAIVCRKLRKQTPVVLALGVNEYTEHMDLTLVKQFMIDNFCCDTNQFTDSNVSLNVSFPSLSTRVHGVYKATTEETLDDLQLGTRSGIQFYKVTRQVSGTFHLKFVDDDETLGDKNPLSASPLASKVREGWIVVEDLQGLLIA